MYRLTDLLVWERLSKYGVLYIIRNQEESVNVVSASSAHPDYPIDVEVEGNTVTVSCALPCRLGYLSEGNYVALEASANPDGSYSFEVPGGVEEVTLVVRGDSDFNGKLSNADATKIKSLLKSSTVPDALQLYAMDMDGNGRITNADAIKIKSCLKGGNSIIW